MARIKTAPKLLLLVIVGLAIVFGLKALVAMNSESAPSTPIPEAPQSRPEKPEHDAIRNLKINP